MPVAVLASPIGVTLVRSGSPTGAPNPDKPRSFVVGIALSSGVATCPGFGAKYPDRVRTVRPDLLTFTLTRRNFPSGAPFDD
jgi:hypothetical protein